MGRIMTRVKTNTDVFCENEEWQYVRKKVNLNNYKIEYENVKGFKTKEDAEKCFKKDILVYREQLDTIKNMTDIRFTFTEYADYWMQNIFLKITNTVTKTLGVWAVYHLILPQVENDMLLTSVTPKYLNELITRCSTICQSGEETAAKYIRRMIKDAYNYGFVRIDIRPFIKQVKRYNPSIQVLNLNQLKVLLAEAVEHPNSYLEILLACMTGLRGGEIRALKFSNCDRKTHTIKIEKQITRNYCLACSDNSFKYSAYDEEKQPKSENSFRTLKVPDFIFDELDNRKKANEEIMHHRNDYTYADYVSLSMFAKVKGKETTPTNLSRICAAAGLPHTTMHGLRHTFATLMLESGMNLETISKILGHKSVATTFDIYCGLADESDKARNFLDSLDPVSEVAL